MDCIRVVELFSGIGAQATALENLGIPFESVCCEIDDSAYEAYCAIHGDTPNLGDITKVEHLPPCDLLTYSFPCQSLSIAGLQKGMEEGSGTTSSLLWEVGRLLDDAKADGRLPSYLLMENVDAILNVKNLPNFRKWIARLSALGYTSAYAVLNAKDYGLPQNRKRCFMVSTLDKGDFMFPPKIPLRMNLGNVLEKDVPEKYYLSEEVIQGYERHKERNRQAGRGFGWKPVTLDEIMSTILTNPSKGSTNTVIEDIVVAGDLNNPKRLEQHNRVYGTEGCAPTLFAPHGCDKAPKIEDKLIRAGTLDKTYDQDSRVYSIEGIAPTMRTGGTPTPIEVDGQVPRIRYLTPRECWRLQGFDDGRIDRAFKVVPSDNARYRMAGNSIAVNCLEAIFKGMLLDGTFKQKQKGIMEW